jgi:hypothetical protein
LPPTVSYLLIIPNYNHIPFEISYYLQSKICHLQITTLGISVDRCAVEFTAPHDTTLNYFRHVLQHPVVMCRFDFVFHFFRLRATSVNFALLLFAVIYCIPQFNWSLSGVQVVVLKERAAPFFIVISLGNSFPFLGEHCADHSLLTWAEVEKT